MVSCDPAVAEGVGVLDRGIDAVVGVGAGELAVPPQAIRQPAATVAISSRPININLSWFGVAFGNE
jgi:hypothetical protein